MKLMFVVNLIEILIFMIMLVMRFRISITKLPGMRMRDALVQYDQKVDSQENAT